MPFSRSVVQQNQSARPELTHFAVGGGDLRGALQYDQEPGARRIVPILHGTDPQTQQRRPALRLQRVDRSLLRPTRGEIQMLFTKVRDTGAVSVDVHVGHGRYRLSGIGAECTLRCKSQRECECKKVINLAHSEIPQST